MKKQNGITLVALVVTIIVLIILAGISINLILGDNGIITKASDAKQLQEMADLKEKIQLEIATEAAGKLETTDGITQKEVEEILSKYGTVNKNDDGEIESLTPENKDYEIPFEEIYSGKVIEPEAVMAKIPEKSEETAFDRKYGVIEIEFLKGTSYKTTSTPNTPNMGSNMKKVYWEDDGTEVLEGDEGFDETKWYKYIAQTGDTESGGTSKWANAVTLDSDGNITGYFVWVPRYAYRIVYFDTQAHEDAYRLTGATDGIVGYSDARGFVDVDGKTPSDMETPVTSISVGTNKLRPHPAFEDGSETGYRQGEWREALEGIWIAKYEVTGSISNLKFLPGKNYIKSTKIGDMYTYALKFSEESKSHMLKNSEWGAMAYFTESKYGRNGTEVTENTESYTAGSSEATVKSNPLQSTTGNYYGIYDTVGCGDEYVAGYIADSSWNYGNSFASTDNTKNNKTESTEYVTVYDMLSETATYVENYNYNTNKNFGDAIIEVSTNGDGNTSWNSNDSTYFGAHWNGDKYPFMERSGTAAGTSPGLYYFNSRNGTSGSITTFRVALCITK